MLTSKLQPLTLLPLHSIRAAGLAASLALLASCGSKEKEETKKEEPAPAPAAAAAAPAADAKPAAAKAPEDNTPPMATTDNSSDQWAVFTRQADDLVKKKNLVDAVAMYQEALKLKPDYSVALSNLGSALMQLGRNEEAIPHLQNALKADTNLTAANLNLANIHLSKNEAAAALPLLQTALKTAPNVPDVYRNLGLVLFQQRDFDGAVTQFRKLLELKPDEVGALAYLGQALIAAGQVEEGQSTLAKAADRPGATLDAYMTLAWTLATNRNPAVRNAEKAIAAAMQAVAMADETRLAAALRTLAAAQAEAKDFDAAIASIKRASEAAAKQNDTAAVDRLTLEQFEFESGRPLRE